MKNLLLLMALFAFVLPVAAQSESPTFVPFQSTLFGLEGIVPENWSSGGPGVYLRSNSIDLARIIIQSAPLPPDQLLSAVLQRMPVDGTPEITGEYVTAYFTWQERTFTISPVGFTVMFTIALAESDGLTALVLLQSAPEEHDLLREQVYLPVLESVKPIAATPLAEEAPYTSEEVTFVSGDVELAGTLTIPQGAGTFPAVVLVSGSGPSDRNESIAPLAEIAPFALLADHLTRNGIAVLRYDDRGVGASGGDYPSTTLPVFAEDALAALAYLGTRAEIRANARGLLGHSEGGAIIAIATAASEDVAFAISMAGTGVAGSETLTTQTVRIYQAMGLPQEQIDFIMEAYLPMMDALRAGDADALAPALRELTVRQINALAPAQMPDDATLDTMVEQGIAQYLAESFQVALRYDPALDWAKVSVPVLAIFGSLDTQVDATQNASALEAALADNPDTTIVTIEGANHLFQLAQSGSPQEYGTLEQTLMPEFLDTVTAWILERTAE